MTVSPDRWAQALKASPRILVYGVTGSGKSTLATTLSRALGYPLTLVDDLSFESNWKPVPLEIQRENISRICDQRTWVLDSAYGKWLDIVLRHDPLIVALDYPRWLSLSRLMKRTLRRCITKEQCCNGNTESFRQAFSKDSIIAWHFKSFASKRCRIINWGSEGAPQSLIRIRSKAQYEQFAGEVDSLVNHNE